MDIPHSDIYRVISMSMLLTERAANGASIGFETQPAPEVNMNATERPLYPVHKPGAF